MHNAPPNFHASKSSMISEHSRTDAATDINRNRRRRVQMSRCKVHESRGSAQFLHESPCSHRGTPRLVPDQPVGTKVAAADDTEACMRFWEWSAGLHMHIDVYIYNIYVGVS